MLTLFAGLTPASAVLGSTGLFFASLVPFFLLVDCDFAVYARRFGLSLAALLLLLTPKGDR